MKTYKRFIHHFKEFNRGQLKRECPCISETTRPRGLFLPESARRTWRLCTWSRGQSYVSTSIWYWSPYKSNRGSWRLPIGRRPSFCAKICLYWILSMSSHFYLAEGSADASDPTSTPSPNSCRIACTQSQWFGGLSRLLLSLIGICSPDNCRVLSTWPLHRVHPSTTTPF